MKSHEESAAPEQTLAGTRVLIVEDEADVARVLSRMLSVHGCRVEIAEAIAEADRALVGDFDAVVLDLDLPDGSGFDLVPALHSGAMPIGVVVVTGNYDKQTVGSSLRAGVTECLSKPFLQDELIGAVERAVRNTRQWRVRMAEAPDPTEATGEGGLRIRAGRSSSIAARLAAQAKLTAREQEVLELMLGGSRNTEIATALDISVHTVKYHARNTLTKLGAESRTDLFRTLAKDGLLET